MIFHLRSFVSFVERGLILCLTSAMLASCVKAPPTHSVPTATRAMAEATVTAQPEQQTATPSLVDTPTATATSSADPRTVRESHCGFVSAVSPDDVWLLTGCHTNGTWVERLDGTERIMVASGTDFPEGINVGSLWSPDGSMLIVTGSIRPIWLIRMSELGNKHTLLHGETLMPHFAPIWSPDGQLLAAEHLEEGVSLSVLYLDGTSRNLLYETDVNWLPKAFESCMPTWSPDGSEIAYLVRPDKERFPDARLNWRQLWVVNISTGTKRFLFDPDGSIEDLSWSPDGQSIAIIVEEGLVILDASTGQPSKTVSRQGAAGQPKWSPDSLRIAFNSDDGLYVVQVSSGDVKRIADPPMWIEHWSADGSVLVVGTDGGTSVSFIPVG